MKMKALSLWQPHAQAIALDLKPWETRGWPTSYRGPLAIHAAKRLWTESDAWHDEARRLMRGFDFRLAYGAVVCVVELVDCVRTSELRGKITPEEEFWGDFSDGERGWGRYAFKLANVQVLAEPLVTRGHQGFFEVELDGFRAPDTLTLPLFNHPGDVDLSPGNRRERHE
jgi:hypothetical protein